LDYRPLGRTELVVSSLGFGCSPLGGVFGDIHEGLAVDAVHVALDLGITFFDVAPFYGLTRAETVLGRALAGVPRSAYVLSTKVGRYGADQFDFSAARVARSVDESCERLGVEVLDVVLCHDVEFGSLDQIVGETVPALRELQRAGRIRAVGASALPIDTLMGLVHRCELDTVLSYCHFHLFDRSLERLLPFLAQRQIGAINASPLAMGLLTGQGPPAWHPAPDRIREACAGAAEYCRRHSLDLAQLALSFAATAVGPATTLVGMATPEEVRRSVAWWEGSVDLLALRQVQALLEPIQGATWTS
jgi:L-galactose dehydrogenase